MSNDQSGYHLDQMRSGDLSSFRWLYNRYHQDIFQYCFTVLGQASAAEEVTSDVFLRLWQKKAIIDPKLPIMGLLRKMAKDHLWNYLKRENRRKQQHQDYLQEHAIHKSITIDDQLTFSEYIRLAESILEEMPEKRRKVFQLHYKGGHSYREIAQQLNIAESTVRVQLHKATKYLRAQLKKHLDAF